jgi:uncharacterized membrane protein
MHSEGSMTHVTRLHALSFLLLLPMVAPGVDGRAQTGVVRAVLFFSPTCPHCHDVIQNHLPVFFDVYGGEARAWMDDTVSDANRSLYLLYNEQLEILLVDATRPLGSRLFVADLERHGIPANQGTVPRMVMGEEVLIGGAEIPARFHSLMRQAQADRGLDWPAIPGIADAITNLPTASAAGADSAPRTTTDSTTPTTADSVAAIGDSAAPTVLPAQPIDTLAPTDSTAQPHTQAQPPTQRQPSVEPDTADTARAEPVPQTLASAHSLGADDTVPPTVGDSAVDSADAGAADADSVASPFNVVPGRPTAAENLRRDPLGSAIAIVVLLGMIASVIAVATTGRFQTVWSKPPAAILLIAGLGIIVAGYLTYVETSGATAVCGPIGDCNAVQQSRYATLFGVLPVGLLGLIGYAAIIVAWLVWAAVSGPASDYAVLTMTAIALVGTLFSIYLTFLEPFVIGATCAWCIASSIAITLLLWLAAGSGKAAWARLRS